MFLNREVVIHVCNAACVGSNTAVVTLIFIAASEPCSCVTEVEQILA